MTADITVRTLSDAHEFVTEFAAMPTAWPEFIEPSRLLVGWGIHAHSEHQLVLLDGEEVVARAAAVPLNWVPR